MSKSNNESTSPKVSPASMVPAPFQRADKRVKNTMRSVPDTLRNAASQLLERVRVGLDIPSRAEVMDLAERISTIAETIEALEIRRNEDSKAIAELKNNKKASPAAPAKPSIVRQPIETGSSLASAAAKLAGRPRAKADFTPQPTPGGPKAPSKKSSSAAKTKAKSPAKAKPKKNSASAAKAKPAAKTSKKKSPAAKTKSASKKATNSKASKKTTNSASKKTTNSKASKKPKTKPASRRKSSK